MSKMLSFSNFNNIHKQKIQTQLNKPISKNRIFAASGYFERKCFIIGLSFDNKALQFS